VDAHWSGMVRSLKVAQGASRDFLTIECTDTNSTQPWCSTTLAKSALERCPRPRILSPR
jgi:hypothetical protein